jgi:uncharacterized integral membrane protein
LSTAQLARPAPVPAVRRLAPVRRLSRLRETTPGRLQLILAVLLILGVVTGAVTGLTAYAARSGTTDLGNRTQPLLLEADQAFLAGGLEPPALTRQYDSDLDRASAALTEASRNAPEGRTQDSIQQLAAGVAEYAGLVATARANNRQGLPVGAAYLNTASTLYRDQLLPQTQSLFQTAQKDVTGGYGDARSTVWVSFLILLLALLLVTLVLAQRQLSRLTHRTFNVPLVVATLATVVLVLTAGGVLIAQRTHLHRADRDGSTPVAQLAEARILALRERGDEALTLAARGSGGAYEDDFKTTASQLSGALGRVGTSTAQQHQNAYVAAHQQVRKLDDGGDYDDAVKLSIGAATTATFSSLTSTVGTALDDRKQAFTDEIDAAGRGLTLLTVLGPLLALIICALMVAGMRPRLEEYR